MLRKFLLCAVIGTCALTLLIQTTPGSVQVESSQVFDSTVDDAVPVAAQTQSGSSLYTSALNTVLQRLLANVRTRADERANENNDSDQGDPEHAEPETPGTDPGGSDGDGSSGGDESPGDGGVPVDEDSGETEFPEPDPVEPTHYDCGGITPLRADGTPWECVYNDEFDATELDRSYWTPQVTGDSLFTTGTANLYTCYEDDERVISLEDGRLHLSLLRLDEVRDCGRGKESQYIAGSVSHWNVLNLTYGRYEVRAKLPDVRAAGSQTAFWLWPEDQFLYGAWPLSGEIDFAEFYSVYPDIVIPRFHYLFDLVDLLLNRNVYTAYHCAINYGEFNDYVLEWKPGQMTILVNDQVCIVNNYLALNAPLDRPFAPFDHPFFLALTQAMGTTGNEYDPVVMPERITTEVEHVRIWQ